MLESGKITAKQLILLLFISRLSLTLTLYHALNEPPKNQDVWLSSIAFFPIAVVYTCPVYFLWKRFPKQTIIEYSKTLFGFSGKFIGLLYVWLFLHITSLATIQFSLFFTSLIMPETPILFFVFSLVLVSAYIVRNGLEVISRLSELSAPLIMIGIGVTSLLLVKEFNLKNLLPIMEAGILPILNGGNYAAMRTFEIIALAMLLPFLNKKENAKKVISITYFLITFYFLMVIMPGILVIGYQHAREHLFLYYDTVRLISIGEFLERVEATLIFTWNLAIFARIPLYYYLTVLALSQLLGLRAYKPFVLPIGGLVIPLSILMGPSLPELIEFLSGEIIVVYGFVYIIFIPLFLWLTAVIRKKRSSKNA